MSLIDREKLLEELKVFQRTNIYLSVKDLITNAPSIEKSEQEPVGWANKIQLSRLEEAGLCLIYSSPPKCQVPVYTNPPQPQSVRDALEKAAKIISDFALECHDGNATMSDLEVVANEILALIEKE
jgi:hypothetical protein